MFHSIAYIPVWGYCRLFTQQIAGNEWNEVAEEFYVLRKTKLSFISLIMRCELGLVLELGDVAVEI